MKNLFRSRRRLLVVLVAAAGAVLLAALARRQRAPPSAPRVVLLITVDTLRADHLGAYGAPAGRTPHLDALAARSVLFESAFAVAPFTLASVSGLMTSRYPEEVGVESNTSALAEGVPTLASFLGQHGFRTGAVVSNVALRAKSGIARGFQDFDTHMPQREKVRRHPERTGRPTTRAALSMLKQLGGFAGQRVFLWVHYQDPHGPYTPPAPFDTRFPEPAGPILPLNDSESGAGGIPDYQDLGTRDAGVYRSRYRGEVAAVDDAIGWLLAELSNRHLLDSALVIFAADHGEGMGEDDYWFAHGERLSDPLVRVPLLLAGPGIAPARRRDTASLLDVLPTIASVLGTAPPAGARGRDLLGARAPETPSTVYQSTLAVAQVRQRALVWRGVQYVAEERPEGVREHVRAADGGSAPPAAALPALRDELQRVRASLDTRQPGRQELSPDELESLKALGYVATR